MTTDKGSLFIISAPSGAGKSTLCQALQDRFPDIRYSVSYTTRPPREGDQEGVDYYFIDEEHFQRGIERNDWAEWAIVHDNYYGTSARILEDTLAAGQDMLLDIDVQGAMQILERFPESVTIFIMPPDFETLGKRLRKRGKDTEAVITRRLENAKKEIAQKDRYRHIIVNDRLEDAVEELIRLVKSYRENSA